jgi:glucose/arabinose dehydrogenase
MPGRAFVTITLALVAGFTTLFFYAKPVMSLPSGFEDNRVVNVPDPTALAFTPDGRMLVTSKRGQLHVFDQDGKALTSPALNLGPKVCSNSERGLLGVAVDPDFEFADRNYVYLYYTYKKFGVCPEHKPANPRNPVNRVSRFVMNGNTVNPDSEIVLIDNIPSPNGNHNAGDVKFGRDEYL